jgi:Uncharacterized protein conserved in bacteria (DUF2066)
MTGGIETRLRRRGAAIAACLVALVAVAGVVRAADESPYTVAKIAVDVTDKSAVAAKNKALAEAEERALVTVLSRVVPFRALAQLPALPPQTAEALVNGLSIRKEQYSTTRYIATLDIILNEQGVKQLLAAYGIPANDARAPMVSVLPVVLEGDKVKAGGSGAWAQAWLDVDVTHGLTPANVLRPRPDLEAGTVRAVLAGDTSAYASLQGEYGSAPLVLAVGEAVGNGQFITRLAGADSVGRINYGRADRIGAQAAKAAAGDAAAFAYAVIENRWKVMQSPGGGVEAVRYEEGVPAAGAPQGEPARSVVAMVPISGLKEWQDIRARLTQVPGIQGLEVNSLSPRMASVAFDYAGSLGLLQKTLGDYGFTFENREEGFVVRAR